MTFQHPQTVDYVEHVRETVAAWTWGRLIFTSDKVRKKTNKKKRRGVGVYRDGVERGTVCVCVFDFDPPNTSPTLLYRVSGSRILQDEIVKPVGGSGV